MFKLPLLQPHLTGSNGVEARTGSGISKYSPFIRSGRDAAASGSDPLLGSGSSGGLGTMEAKDWESQARDITTDVTSSDKYKSIALHAEVKLAEALERCTRVCPTSYGSDGEEKPNKLKTAVCCQLLGEFAELCGPFSAVLKSIKDELVRSVYSPLYVSEKGLLVFDQLPWFSVAERLEAEKAVMVEERAKFEEMLHEQQAVIARIEEQLGVYQRATAAAQLEAAGARSKLESLVASEEGARLEAKTGREELKRLRKEWLRMRDDLDGERASAARAKEGADQDISNLRAQIAALSSALELANTEAVEARDLAAVSLPPSAVSGLQDSVAAAEAALVEARKRIKDLEGSLQDANEKINIMSGTMTPRPSFREMRKFGVEDAAAADSKKSGKSSRVRTQELVDAAAARLEAYVAARDAARAAAELADAVLAPEPAPAEITLAVATDASAYFITEGSEEGGGAGASKASSVSVEGLGTGPSVPRCLRWPSGEMVAGLDVMDVQEAQSRVWDIILAKQVHDASHPAEHMQSFLYHFCAQAAKSDKAAAAVAQAAGGSKGKQRHVHIATGEQPAAHAEPVPGALHAAVVRKAYGIYHAASSHARASPLLRMFWAVLTGQLPEAALTDVRLQFAALLHAARTLATPPADEQAAAEASADAGEGGEAAPSMFASRTVATGAVHEALGRLAPSRPSYKMSRLKDVYSSNVAPEAASLAMLEELLQPLAWGCDTARVAAAVESDIKAASAAADAEATSPPSNVRASVTGQAAAPAAPQQDQQQQRLGELLSHPFISTFMQQHLEDVQNGATEMLAAVEQLPGVGAAPASKRASVTGVATGSGAAGQLLGGQVAASAVLQALCSAGLSEEQAARAVAAAAGTAGSSGAGLSGSDLAAVVTQAAAGVSVWCGLATAKLASEVLLKPQALHQVPGVLAWVAESSGSPAAAV